MMARRRWTRTGILLIGGVALAACAETATAPTLPAGDRAALVTSFDALALAAGDASSFGAMVVGFRGGLFAAPVSFSTRDDRIATVQTAWQGATPRAVVRAVNAGTTYVIVHAGGGLIDSVRVDVH